MYKYLQISAIVIGILAILIFVFMWANQPDTRTIEQILQDRYKDCIIYSYYDDFDK